MIPKIIYLFNNIRFHLTSIFVRYSRCQKQLYFLSDVHVCVMFPSDMCCEKIAAPWAESDIFTFLSDWADSNIKMDIRNKGRNVTSFTSSKLCPCTYLNVCVRELPYMHSFLKKRLFCYKSVRTKLSLYVRTTMDEIGFVTSARPEYARPNHNVLLCWGLKWWINFMFLELSLARIHGTLV